MPEPLDGPTIPRSIGITGATGYIGRELTAEALQRGLRVRTFTRRSWLGAPHVPVADRRTLVLPAAPELEDLEGLDAVINLAVAAHGSSEAVSRAINVHGTRVLADALERAGVPRFVHVSTQSAHAGALNRYGRTKWDAEQVLDGRPGTVIVRPGLVDDGGEGAGLLARSARAAARLRVFPVMAGSHVQLLRMEELVDVLLLLADPVAMPAPPHLVELAHPEVMDLGDVVAATAAARHGVRPRIVAVPLAPVRLAARIGRKVPPAAPIAEVVDGVLGHRTMDTADQLHSLGIHLAAFDPAPRAARTWSADGPEPRRMVVVGAGRIGSLHAMVAAQHPDGVLDALIDPAPVAGVRTAMASGRWVPHHRSIEAARAAGHLGDVAVIATPPATHLPVAVELLDAGLDVLVEKPAAPEPVARGHLVAHAAGAKGVALVGYHLTQLPHLRAALDRFAGGDLGAPTSFVASAWVARASASGRTLSWELDPDQQGGVLGQVPAHVLSVLDLFLGRLEVRRATQVRGPGRLVDDAAWVELAAGDVAGALVCGWHLPEFSAPENSVRIDTDRGRLVLALSGAAFVPADGSAPWFAGALAGSQGFDPAPLDGAAGFWLEQRTLLRGMADRNGLEVAGRVESVVDAAREAAVVVAPPTAVAAASATPPEELAPSHGHPLLVDVRRTTASDLGALDCRVVCGADDAAAYAGRDPLVILPDGPRAFRFLTNDGPLALIADRGFGRLAMGAVRCDPRYSFEPAGIMWEAIGTLLRAELSLLPRTFQGDVALDGYIVDLAASIGRLEQMHRMVRTLRRRLPAARIGVETNAPRLAARVLPVVADEIDFVLAVGDPELDVAADVRSMLGRDIDVIVKTGSQPWEVVDAAQHDPAPWIGSGSALVLDGRGSAACRLATTELYRRAVVSTGCPPEEVDRLLAGLGLATS